MRKLTSYLYFNCIGNEAFLTDCPYGILFQCSIQIDAGVGCLNGKILEIKVLLNFILFWVYPVSDCANDEIYLVEGVSQHGPINGIVEICLNGQRGTVCTDDWDVNDATVVCRQIGLPTRS